MSRPSRPVAAAAAVLVVLVAMPAGIGYADLRGRQGRGLLPQGTTVGGADVSGLDRASAVTAVKRATGRDLDRPATFRVGDRSYTTTLRELGASVDVDRAVATAFEASSRGSWAARELRRLTHPTQLLSVPVKVSVPRPDLVAALVSRAVAESAVAPVNARVSVVRGWLGFRPARNGQRVDPAAVGAALEAALRGGSTSVVVPRVVEPEVGDSAYETVLLVRTGENRLVVYRHGRPVRTFPVATGAPDFPTPTGHFHVALKRYLPTWVNPHPNEGWGRLEPPTIPPGPDNPLGTRALNLDVPNIRIHGTPATASVGYSASHGCIRMRMPDVEALYPMVATGTSVFVTAVGPPRLPPPGAGVSVASLAEGG